MLLGSEPKMAYCIFKEYEISLLLKLYKVASVARGFDVHHKTRTNNTAPERNRQVSTFNYETHSSRYVFA